MVDMGKAMDMAMVDMDKARADMAMADTEHLAMVDTDITREGMVTKIMDMAKNMAHMAMKTMDTKTEMILLAMVTKNMGKRMADMAMETADTVTRADMATETVD